MAFCVYIATLCPFLKANPFLKINRSSIQKTNGTLWSKTSDSRYMPNFTLKFQSIWRQWFFEKNFLEFTNLWFKNQGLRFCMSPWYHLRIPTRGHLVVKMIFQNFKFQIFVHYNEISKKFSSWSKKFKLHRKLNDGSPGYWEKYFGVSDMFLRHFKMRLKIFLEAHFFELQEGVQIFKKSLSPNTLDFWAKTLTQVTLRVWLREVRFSSWSDERLIFKEGVSLQKRA